MFELMYQQMQVAFAERVNKFIYTVRRIPFIGKYIPEELYARVSLKRVLAVLAAIWSVFGDILGKLLYFLFAICLGVAAVYTVFDGGKNAFTGQGIMLFWIFFFMNFLLGSFVNSKICACDEKDYLLVGLLRIDAKKYFLLKMFKSQITQIIYYTVFMIVAQHIIFDESLTTVLLYMLGFAAFRFIGEAVRLFLNDRFGMPFTDKKLPEIFYNIYTVIMSFVAYGTFYLLIFLKYVLDIDGIVYPDIRIVATNPVFLILSVVLAVLSIRYIVNYQNYPLVAKRLAGFSTVMEQKAAVDALVKVNQNVEADELSEKETGQKIFEEKQGYEYLNAIFFKRHKKLFSRPKRIKTAVSLLLMAASIIFLLIYRFDSTAKEYTSFANDVWGAMDRIITLFVFIMYCITSGRNITKALFYNCDCSLLKYGYYRRPDAILKNFRIRLRFMIKNEMPMVAVLSAGFTIDTILLGKADQWLKLVSIIGCIVMLAVFYSVVYLCMYYIFQPYTEGGNETGVGYSVCKGTIYVMSYMCLQMDTLPQYFVFIVMGVTVTGLIAGYVLAYMMAPKRFVLK